MADTKDTAVLSTLAYGSGDGYGFGGGAVVTFAGVSLIVGEGSRRQQIAEHIVAAINAYAPLPPDTNDSPF